MSKKEMIAHWVVDESHNKKIIICDYCNTWFHKDDRFEFMLYCPYCKAKIER